MTTGPHHGVQTVAQALGHGMPIIRMASGEDNVLDSDDEEFKFEKPTLNAEQAQELNQNILSAMDAAHNIAKEIDNPQELDDDKCEMILFLTQKAISDLKELHQKNKYSPPPIEDASTPFQTSPERKIN